MERQPQSSHDAYADADAAVAGFLKLGVDEEREEAHEVKPAEISLPGEGGEEQEAQSEPELGAAAEGKEAGDEGEGKEGCDVSVGAAGPADGESREAEAEAEAEAGGGEGGEQGGEEQPPRAAVEGPEAADGQRRVPHDRFTRVQLQDLERVFQHTQYPNERTRQELTRRMGVTEAKVKGWFRNRRAKWRRLQRALMFRNVPPMPPGPPVVVRLCEPCFDILLQELNWICVLLEPLPPGLPGLPMPPMPPMRPMPPLQPMRPMPPMPPVPPMRPVPPVPPMPPVRPMPPMPPVLPVAPMPPVWPMPPMPPMRPMLPFPPMLLPPPPWLLPPLLPCRCPHASRLGPLSSAVLR
ncbi:homeobox protein ESX1-like [Eubalaena glacialis]|uniref:homeobox protein ESX1-like n=1 Tax=Eubalaena glacialis TaxID=27606 RepID=UPI002A5AA750|nr:homeobox protein ESX1-like [Eubalaena glacialis]